MRIMKECEVKFWSYESHDDAKNIFMSMFKEIYKDESLEGRNFPEEWIPRANWNLADDPNYVFEANDETPMELKAGAELPSPESFIMIASIDIWRGLDHCVDVLYKPILPKIPEGGETSVQNLP